MGVVSTFLGESWLNAAFRNVAFTSPAKVYLALYTNDPGDGNTGTEVTGGSYARQEVTFGAPAVINNKSTIKNSADVVFPAATADWGTITHVGIMTAQTDGNLLYYGPVSTAKQIDTGDQFKAAANNIVVDID